MIMPPLLQILCGLFVVAILAIALFRALTYDPNHEEIEARERNNPNIGQKYILRSCSQPVTIEIAEAYRKGNNGKKYEYEYTIKH